MAKMETSYIEQFLTKAKKLSRWWIIEGLIILFCLTFIITFVSLEATKEDNKIVDWFFFYLGIKGNNRKLILFIFIYYLISIALGVVCTIKYFSTIKLIDKICCDTNENELKQYLKKEKRHANISYFLSYFPVAFGLPIFYIFSLFSKITFTKTLAKIKVCDCEKS